MTTQELQQLMADMSMEEKIGQLVQLPSYFQNAGNVTGPASEMGLTNDDLRLAGSYLSIVGAEKVRQLQTEYMANHPHHIPLILMADIINGYRTVFPIPLAQGCTFQPGLVEKGAAIAAREAAASGVHVTFSPMADLVRDARWGRVMESTGEDPYLNSQMAAAMVRGYQGEKLTDRGHIAACLKHFAGYGAPEGGRDYNNAELSPRTLRQDYLPAYQAAVDAGCEMVMTSFNTLDRVPSTANRWLMRDVLRGEMGFDSVLISDWGAVGELIPHGVAADCAQAAELAIRAGVDMDMSSPCYIHELKALVESGRVPESLIDAACWRVLSLKNRLGLFENPFKDLSTDDEATLLLCPEHRKTAQECAENSFVLLRNEDAMLPLSRSERVAFIGPYVDNQLTCGSWSIFSDDADAITLRTALIAQENLPDSVFAAGCPLIDPQRNVIGFQKAVSADNISPEAALEEAVALARNADKVVLALGEHREQSGESSSQTSLTLADCQLRLLDAVAAVNPNVVVVLYCGRPLDLRAVQAKAKAILLAWLPGTEGGPAIARTLYGECAPSGRLSMAFPYCVGQLPMHYNHLNTGRPFHGDYRESRMASKYQDAPNEPLYPFGFGLTYTTFSYSPVHLDAEVLASDGMIHASVTVSNTGSREGTETVQLYLRDLVGSVARPVRELKGFQRVTLQPGESADVTFTITEEMLRFWNIDMRFTSEPGEFDLFIGPDCQTSNCSHFTLV